MSRTIITPVQTSSPSLPSIHLLLSVQTGVVILVSINRLGDWTNSYVVGNQFLRWVDLNNMLILRLTRMDSGILIFNGLFIGLGIFANLAFEEIGFDLTVVFLLGILALGLLWRYGRQPLLVYYSTAYTLGLIATVFYKGVSVF